MAQGSEGVVECEVWPGRVWSGWAWADYLGAW